jgi:hypothetical protein
MDHPVQAVPVMKPLHVLGLGSIVWAVAAFGCGVSPAQCGCASTKIVTITVQNAQQQPLSQFHGSIDGVPVVCPPGSIDAGTIDGGVASDAASVPSMVAQCSGTNAVSIQYFTVAPIPMSVHVTLQNADGSQSIDQDVSLTLTTDTGCCGGPRGSATVSLH